jgi:hypothetical protein
MDMPEEDMVDEDMLDMVGGCADGFAGREGWTGRGLARCGGS